ncbi:MAG: hypothetical protein QNJ54_30660 [Prochloraceae cyanobacterium]|nr:hypothetical protein [Prochloraceae cyanobacterium]
MKLTAKLTTGWDCENLTGLTATELHEAALSEGNYVEYLSSQLSQKQVSEIFQLEQLFRKNTQGFQPIKKFVGALSSCENIDSLYCYIDAFAYSFLKGAKNFDCLLPFEIEHNNEFIKTYQQWSKIIEKLENFERFGENIPQKLAKQYLALRKIISRLSVQEELRTLATLLVNGPSSLEQVSKDLDLNYTLGQRTVGIFENISVVEKVDSQDLTIYRISTAALPVVIFGLRETIGLDLLSNLDIYDN